MTNLRSLTQCIRPYVMLYPQNGDRIVTIDYMTSLHPMFSVHHKFTTGLRLAGSVRADGLARTSRLATPSGSLFRCAYLGMGWEWE